MSDLCSLCVWHAGFGEGEIQVVLHRHQYSGDAHRASTECISTILHHVHSWANVTHASSDGPRLSAWLNFERHLCVMCEQSMMCPLVWCTSIDRSMTACSAIQAACVISSAGQGGI